MSSLGPDGGSLEQDGPTGDAAAAPYSSPAAPEDDASTPSLWTAFRDYYTRARERRGRAEAGEWVAQAEDFARSLPPHSWECRGT